MFNNGNDGMVMPVAPMYGGGYGNNGFGFGGDGIWGGLLLGLLFGGLGGWGGFGGFGGGWGGMMGMDAMMLAPYFFNTQTQNDVNRGFDTQNLGNQIASVQNSVENVRTSNQLSDIQSAITSGFASAEVANCGRAMDAMQTAYNNQIAGMNQNFANQQALDARLDSMAMAQQKCCCDAQLQGESIRATILSENCEDRNQALLNTRDLLTAGTANTQTIVDAVRGINDKLCQLELDGKNDRIADLERQLTMANLSASQTAQTAALVQDNNAQTAALIQRIAPYPVPTVPFNGFYGWNNWNGNGCGCGNVF